MLFLAILAPLPLPAQRRIVSVPFRSVNTYLLVEASVDGRPVTLLVDTGASKTILNARSVFLFTSGFGDETGRFFEALSNPILRQK